MTPRHGTVYLTRGGDTLESIAAKFGLSSWRAIADAPANNLDAAATTKLPQHRQISIPPSARMLLVERLRALHRVRPELQGHFDGLDVLFRDRLTLPEVVGELSDACVVEDVLVVLVNRVRDDVARVHELARQIAELNVALARTHLHAEGDLSRFVTPDTTHSGLNWLLTPQRLELWSEMWDTEFWTARWRGKNQAQARRLAEIHLNMVRSQVLQQSDRRIRETLSAIGSAG